MEKKIRKRYKRARASWKRAAAKSGKIGKAETSKRRAVALVALALLAFATSANVAVGAEPTAKPAFTMDDLHRSSCRVVGTSGGNATQIGSGLTVGELENDYVVKTNAHVVDGCKSFVVQYFGDGVPVSVDAWPDRKFYDSRKQYDEAFLTVSRADLDGYDPPIVPLAPPERAQIDPTRPIFACGCPSAREPEAWVGRTIGEFGRLQTFKPAPLQGQSGSGIVQRGPDGRFECRATLTYRSAETAQNFDFDAAHGLAIPVKFLYEAASGRVVDFSAPVPEGIIPLRLSSANGDANSAVSEVAQSDDAVSPRYEPAVWVGESDVAPLAFEPTRPLLLYFSAEGCGACRRSTPVVEEFARKGWPVKALDVETSEGGRAWRAYRFDVVPAFAFVEIDAAGQHIATLDAWVGTQNCAERIASNFKNFKPRPRPKKESQRGVETAAIPLPTFATGSATSTDGAPLVPCSTVAVSETAPELIFFGSTRNYSSCREVAPIVETLQSKGLRIHSVDVDDPLARAAWRFFGCDEVPAFAFVEVDGAGRFVATLDVWTGAEGFAERIASNFKNFKSRELISPPRRDETSTFSPTPLWPTVACRFDASNVRCDDGAEIDGSGEIASFSATVDGVVSPTLTTDPDEPPLDATSNDAEKEESLQTLETNDLPAVAFGFGETVETSETSTAANAVDETSAKTLGDATSNDAEQKEESLQTLENNELSLLLSADDKMSTTALELGETNAEISDDAAPPKTVDELLKRYERGWTPPFRDAVPGLGTESDGSGGVDGSSPDSTAGLIGGAVERAAREKVEALAAELEKAARERIDAVAGELETSARERVATLALEAEKAARAKAEALAAEVEEAARTEFDELSQAVGMSATALIGCVEQEATAKLENAVDALKRRAFATCGAVGVCGAFAAGAWYWLVRLLAKCWGTAPKYRLVRDDGGSDGSV